MHALEQLPRGAKAAIIRLRSLGDCVLTTPAISILKASRPDLRIAVIVEPQFASIFDGNPDIETVIEPALRALRRWSPDLCINLHGGTRSLMMTAASGARLRAGFAHHRAASVYNVRIPRAQEILGVERTVHTAEHLASAMFYLGAARQVIPRASLFAARWPAAGPYAMLHPVAATPQKTWPAERFLALARHLKDNRLEPVFIGGLRDDLSAFTDFRVIQGAPLEEIKSLLRDAALFAGNDSGPAHMAAAFGIPAIVLFGPSDPVVWAPWRTESRVFAARPITGIAAADVLAAAVEMGVTR